MLGIGFGKILLLLFVVLIAWYGWKYVRRVEQVRQALRQAHEAARRGGGPSPRLEAEEMVKCRVCGTYVAAKGAARCHRPECPL